MIGKMFVGVIVLFGFCLVPAASATTTVVRTGEAVSLADNQRVEGNFYSFSSNVSLSGEVNGDVIAGAGTVTIRGPVSEDVLLLGGTVGVHATVTDDVRIIGGDVTISESVGGSVVVMGGNVAILSTANIAGDVLLLAGSATIEGTVAGTVMGRAEQVRIDGAVGAVDMYAHRLTLGDRAVVARDVKYVSELDLVRAPGASVAGSVTRNDVPPVTSEDTMRPFLIGFLVSLFASLSLYLVLRRPLERYAKQTVEHFGIRSLVGILAILVVPIVIIILTVSLLGLFLGLLSFTLYLLVMIVAIPLMNIVAGALLSYALQKKILVNTLFITLGAILVQAMVVLPYIGIVFLFVLFTATIGGLISGFYTLARTR
ncbi:MAG: hypothetical protein RLZZ70_577 [Candidatus Parcubacteria bacterium]|jgi:cytoskeletal protein CcmA (bactofilin family)